VLAYWKFESISLQRGVCKLSVPRDHHLPEREFAGRVTKVTRVTARFSKSLARRRFRPN